MIADQRRFRSMVRSSTSICGRTSRSEIAPSGLAEEIRRSIERRQFRARHLPQPTFPMDLPVVDKRDEIAKAIDDNQVIVLCGETGSGKTTQLPKICLELGRGVGGMIGHTQPRRIAARSVAQRIAQELTTECRAMSSATRCDFSDHVGPNTFIKLMTDGILLAETQGDRFLDAYDTLIIDEAHERSLNIDFLLGYIRQTVPQAAGTEGHHHLGHDRPAAVQPAF